MRQRLSVILISGTLIAMGGAAMAHHSFAMFDNENQIELEGVVQEFKYTTPHTFILLEVKAQDGSVTVWNLEGVSGPRSPRPSPWSCQETRWSAPCPAAVRAPRAATPPPRRR